MCVGVFFFSLRHTHLVDGVCHTFLFYQKSPSAALTCDTVCLSFFLLRFFLFIFFFHSHPLFYGGIQQSPRTFTFFISFLHSSNSTFSPSRSLSPRRAFCSSFLPRPLSIHTRTFFPSPTHFISFHLWYEVFSGLNAVTFDPERSGALNYFSGHFFRSTRKFSTVEILAKFAVYYKPQFFYWNVMQ